MTKQEKLALWIAILAFVAGAGSQLNDLFSPLGTFAPVVVKEITTLCALSGGILALVLKANSTTSAQTQTVVEHADESATQEKLVLRVADYPGVDKIQTNQRASPILKSLALDPEIEKVEPNLPGR